MNINTLPKQKDNIMPNKNKQFLYYCISIRDGLYENIHSIQINTGQSSDLCTLRTKKKLSFSCIFRHGRHYRDLA